MTRWFEVWCGQIESVTVEKETERCVWIDGRRRNKDGWCQFFPTWEAARQQLINETLMKINEAQANLHRYKSALGVIESMTAPQNQGEPRG